MHICYTDGMMGKQEDAQARREFFAKMSALFGDDVLSVEMVCLEAEDDVLALLQLKRVQRHVGLWGLLIVCKSSLHFYVHPAESVLFGFFRAPSKCKTPAEQSLSFNMFKSWSAARIENRSFFGKKYQKYCLLITAKLADGTSLVFNLRTQNKADTVFEKIAQVPRGSEKTSGANS